MATSSVRLGILVFLFLCVAGCSTTYVEEQRGDASSEDDAGIDAMALGPPQPDAGDSGDSAPTSFTHAPLPQLTNLGGPTIKNVKLVTITFAGDSNENAVKAFGDKVVTSSWLTTVGADYGAAGGTHSHVTLPDAAPTSVITSDTESSLAALIKNGTLPGGVSTTPTDYLYMIVYPPSTVIGDVAPGMDCASTGDIGGVAWHQSVRDATQSFAYAVIPTCGHTPTALLESTMSHELIEAITDPYPLDRPAFQVGPESTWHYAMAESADLCESLESYPDPASGLSLTRVWSNRAAAAGGWPCIPAPTMPYVNVAPAVDEIVSVHAGDVVRIPLGAWSSAPTAPWVVGAYSENPKVTASLDKTRVAAGDIVTLTATVAPDADGSLGPFLISIASKGDAGYIIWPIVLKLN